MYTVEYLKANSNLPGPRGNLELLYKYAGQANEESISECLKEICPDTTNSPEEFVGMCGIVGYAVLNRDNPKEAIGAIRKFASHQSWRIREAVAIGIQEMAEGRISEIQNLLSCWVEGNQFEQRAVVAALCEPKLLPDDETAERTLEVLALIIHDFKVSGKLEEGDRVLRKALGYGFSVAIVGAPEKGMKLFEAFLKVARDNKHIQWILKENLKKNRLVRMNEPWTDRMKELIN